MPLPGVVRGAQLQGQKGNRVKHAILLTIALDSTKKELAELKAILAAEIELGKRRLSEIEDLKREIAALKIRTATTTDQ